MAWDPPSAAAAELIRTAAGQLLKDPGPLFLEMEQAEFAAAPVFQADETLAAEVVASNRANVVRWLTATTQRPGDVVGSDVVPEALDIARDFVRRGFDHEALITGYRQGQNVIWRRLMAGITEAATRESEQLHALGEALDVAARSLFRFVDDVLLNVAAQIDRERGQLVSADLSRRLETVRLVLEGAPISEQRASTRLGYDLAGEQLAVIVWTTDATTEPGAPERAAEAIGRAAGSQRPFVVPAGTAGIWGWLHSPDATLLDGMAGRLGDSLPPGVQVAVGTVGAGAAGFRRSHREALAVRRLVERRPGSDAVTAYADVEIAILSGTDLERTNEFVNRTLGALLEAGDELRATLRVYLQEQGSVSRAAARLFMHRNTVQNRVARAEALLPRPIGSRPLAVALALELEHWLGAEPWQATADR